jgi:CubicO group peptidase (beta-lactamase class C family)
MPGLPSGGGGLYSTAADYFQFAQMMLNGGELNGKRYLKSSTVAMMRTNVLNDQTLNSKSGIGPVHLSPELGFGYDFAVMRDPVALKSPAREGLVLVVGDRRHLVFQRPGQRSACSSG